MNKKLLVAAIGGLLVSGNAAAVNLQSGPALVYANEINAPFTVTTVNASPQDLNDDIAFNLGYNFSGGEVRYGRLECSSNMTMSNPVISEASADITLGAVNGAGTNALFFSITATNPVSGPTTGVQLNVDADIAFANKLGTNCEFSIYDQPSQAQSGGATGRIYSTGSRPFATFADSIVFTTNGGRSTADVLANPAYSAFTGSPEDDLFGSLTFGLVASTPLDKDGLAITLADMLQPSTSVTLTGSFSAIAAAGDVTWNGVGASSINAGKTVVTFVGNSANSGDFGYTDDLNTEIATANFTAALVPVNQLGYTVAARSVSNAGEIDRNGTQIQAPLVHVPASGYVSRIALTNTGSVVRPYTIRVLKEDGTTLSTGTLTGTIPANGTKVVELNTVITGFTAGAPRATVIVTADAPSTDIQGLYQIVNPASGAISNHVMVRPNTN
ncbi:MAG: hypothetical protein ACOY37_11375 [Pseudomonadota bacterium]